MWTSNLTRNSVNQPKQREGKSKRARLTRSLTNHIAGSPSVQPRVSHCNASVGQTLANKLHQPVQVDPNGRLSGASRVQLQVRTQHGVQAFYLVVVQDLEAVIRGGNNSSSGGGGSSGVRIWTHLAEVQGGSEGDVVERRSSRGGCGEDPARGCAMHTAENRGACVFISAAERERA